MRKKKAKPLFYLIKEFIEKNKQSVSMKTWRHEKRHTVMSQNNSLVFRQCILHKKERNIRHSLSKLKSLQETLELGSRFLWNDEDTSITLWGIRGKTWWWWLRGKDIRRVTDKLLTQNRIHKRWGWRRRKIRKWDKKTWSRWTNVKQEAF